jgi:hypothetical protein
VAVSCSRTAPFVTVTAVRGTAWDSGSNAVINVCSLWDMISYHTALSYPASTLVTKNDDDPRGVGHVCRHAPLLILHLKCRGIFRPVLAAVIQAGR